ncbi:N-acyl-D-amino-acid deacylase family protein [Pedobacter sp.]
MIKKGSFLITVLLVGLTTAVFAQKQKVDVLIKNACVFIGDGKDSVFTNVGITAQRISYIGKAVVPAKEVIDGTGKYLAPGFIDPHTHADRWIEDRNRQEMLAWLYQGVTTVFAGNDGFGPYQIAEKQKLYEEIGMGTNFAFFVGFGPVRDNVLGKMNVQPTSAQLNEMKLLVENGMKEGALGFSTGLIYLPQMYSKSKEIKELYNTAAKYGAVYDTHMRSEGNKILESVDEVLNIGAKTALPLHISHLKITGENNWGEAQKVVDKINEARANGVNLTANQYPFIASMTSFKATIMPAWAQEGGNERTLKRLNNPEDLERIKASLAKRNDEGYQRIVLMSNISRLKKYTGKSVYQIAQETNQTCVDAAIEILKTAITISSVNFGMSEEDIVTFMKQPWVMTGSDGGGLHPRTYSTFTKIIEEYVQKKKVLSMSWAIHRATGLTATTFNIKDRGFIKEGYFADLIVFDPNNVKTRSTFEKPEQYAQGMDYVFVNGEKAIDKGKSTGKLVGQFIKK